MAENDEKIIISNSSNFVLNITPTDNCCKNKESEVNVLNDSKNREQRPIVHRPNREQNYNILRARNGISKPFRSAAPFYLGLWGVISFLFLGLNLKISWIISYLLIINIITLFLYYYDKLIAVYNAKCEYEQTRNLKPRVSESSLLFFAFLGGSPMAIFCQFILHHKIAMAFQIQSLSILILQFLIINSALLYLLIIR